jgi:hypothetical protein
MPRTVPFDTSYEQIRKFENTAFALLFFSSILILLEWLLSKAYSENFITVIEIVKEFSRVLSYVGMLSYLLINLLARILFHTVEKRKRNDLIDNSFGTRYADENTEGYYNNSETHIGVKKLALNSYESSFHTENTLKYMLYKNLFYLVLFSIPFFLSIFSKNGNEIVRLLFEISIPLTLLSQFVIMFIYFQNVLEINERFKIELTNIGDKEMGQDDFAKLLIPVLDYYSIKAWANINLDSKIFMKYNRIISDKWTIRKENLKLIRTR